MAFEWLLIFKVAIGDLFKINSVNFCLQIEANPALNLKFNLGNSRVYFKYYFDLLNIRFCLNYYF